MMIWTRSHWWHCHCRTAVTLYFLWMHLIVCNYIQLGKLFYVPAFGSSSSVKFIRLNFLWNGDWVLLSWVRERTCLSCPSIFEEQMLSGQANQHLYGPFKTCAIDYSCINRFHFLIWFPYFYTLSLSSCSINILACWNIDSVWIGFSEALTFSEMEIQNSEI